MIVGILFGSESDREVMAEAGRVLERFGIGHELKVLSAHRNPDALREHLRAGEERGIKIWICGAGLAAHLAGAVAAASTRPVLGVPLAAGSLNGLDSLLSTVQMPAGVPVGTLAIGKAGAKNAGLLAVQILALSDGDLAGKLRTLKEALARGESL